MPLSPRSNNFTVLGLDIGGANLKAATANGQALTVPFALWREPQGLLKRLRDILNRFPHDRLAITMTGELCDCFATKREGVNAILDSVAQAARTTDVRVWSTKGLFVSIAEARADPMRVAAANWHALATFAGRFVPEGAALLIDIGSTTVDIIPLWQGLPTPRGLTDPKRMAHGELLYTGVRRTPVCAVLGSTALDALGHPVAAEYFATMHDVYLVLGLTPPEPDNRDTADGRPATPAAAHARLARMACHDVESFAWQRVHRMARQVFQFQSKLVAEAVKMVADSLPERPQRIVLAGIGEYLLRRAWPGRASGARVVSLTKLVSPAAAAAACAYALAVLGEEMP